MSDTEDPPLPPMRGGSSPPFNSFKRSRGRASSDSSDVPFFSSDDLADASVAKSTRPRRRNQHQRAWFEKENPSQAHSYRRMKTLTRKPKDSGVFMNSDTSNTSSEDGFNVASFNFKRPVNTKMEAFGPAPVQPAPAPEPKPVPATNRDDEIVNEIVHRCLDNSNEVVDLHNRGLEEIKTPALGGLCSMIKPPAFDKYPVPEGAFKPLTPELQIFLSANRLQQIPREIFDLENLTVLSLRNNLLTEVSPAIRHCTGLKELNVASNQLQWLPFDILTLLLNPHLRLKTLRSRPNLFVQPCGPPRISHLGQSASHLDSADWLKQHLRDLQDQENKTQDHASILHAEWLLHLVSTERFRKYTLRRTAILGEPHDDEQVPNHPIYLAMTSAAYFHSDGIFVPGKIEAPPSSISHIVPVDDDQEDSSHHEGTQCQGAPSLFELSLRACAASGQLPEIFSMSPDDETPEPVLNGLHAAENAVRERRLCGFCERPYVLARAEWIEYWGYCPAPTADCRPERVMEYVLPFLRRVCSWGCAQGARSQGRKEREEIFANEWWKSRVR